LDASVSAFRVARHLHLIQHFAAALVDRAVLEFFYDEVKAAPLNARAYLVASIHSAGDPRNRIDKCSRRCDECD